MPTDAPTRKHTDELTEQRLDRWLWAARFFKTRGLAAEAVSGGLVHLNGARVKPAKPTRIGDRIAVQRGELTTVVVVRALNQHRGPAAETALLHAETEESTQAREAYVAHRRMAAASRIEKLGRPTKQARRESIRLRRGNR